VFLLCLRDPLKTIFSDKSSALKYLYYELILLLLMKYFSPHCSDQKDPFNRSPLTLEMVQPHTELKTKIEQWLASVKGQKRI